MEVIMSLRVGSLLALAAIMASSFSLVYEEITFSLVLLVLTGIPFSD